MNFMSSNISMTFLRFCECYTCKFSFRIQNCFFSHTVRHTRMSTRARGAAVPTIQVIAANQAQSLHKKSQSKFEHLVNSNVSSSEIIWENSQTSTKTVLLDVVHMILGSFLKRKRFNLTNKWLSMRNYLILST